MATRKQQFPNQVEFVAWIPENGDADGGITLFGFPNDFDDVASAFCEIYDSEACHYPDERVVYVKKISTGEVKAFTVYGENTRAYRAREKIDLAFTDPHGEHGKS